MSHATDHDVLRDLDDGLLLRHGRVSDATALAAFNAEIHRNPGSPEPDIAAGVWTRDLLTRPHPTLRPDDFTLVEDRRSGTIVSSLNLIPQTWTYGGIPFGVGRVELVGTLPEYRRRGLVRRQMEVVHAWSAARGHLAQAITGIPFYYRQFGYDMALGLGGGRAGYVSHLPRLRDGEAEAYRVRPATADDLPFIHDLYAASQRRYLVSCPRDSDTWRYELLGKSEQSGGRLDVCAIEAPDGQPVGFVGHAPQLWGDMFAAQLYEVKPGVSWLAVTPSVIRYLWAAGEALAARRPGPPMQSFGFWLGSDHPVYTVLGNRLPRVSAPYAYYMRVPDVAAFLLHIRPVLEGRLAASVAAGHSGDLRISFYRGGVCLTFEHGRLTHVEAWQPSRDEGGDVRFPHLTFLQVLFGYRALDEVEAAYADCYPENQTARVLTDVLFPKALSDVWCLS